MPAVASHFKPRPAGLICCWPPGAGMKRSQPSIACRLCGQVQDVAKQRAVRCETPGVRRGQLTRAQSAATLAAQWFSSSLLEEGRPLSGGQLRWAGAAGVLF